MHPRNPAGSRRVGLAYGRVALLAAMLVAAVPSFAVRAADAPPVFANAADTDPVKLGWMVGFPPPSDRQIRFDDGSHFRFP